LTYRFVNEDGLEKDANGNLKLPQSKEKSFRERINQMHGDFVKRYDEKNFSKDKQLENTDMKYKIETNDTPSVLGSPGIRIDIYSTSGTTERKPIVEDKVEVHLILNKKVQVDLEEDGLVFYSTPSKPKLKW
jgi:hypothetical protein